MNKILIEVQKEITKELNNEKLETEKQNIRKMLAFIERREAVIQGLQKEVDKFKADLEKKDYSVVAPVAFGTDVQLPRFINMTWRGINTL